MPRHIGATQHEEDDEGRQPSRMQDIMGRLRHHDFAEGIAEQHRSPTDERNHPDNPKFSKGLEQIIVRPGPSAIGNRGVRREEMVIGLRPLGIEGHKEIANPCAEPGVLLPGQPGHVPDGIALIRSEPDPGEMSQKADCSQKDKEAQRYEPSMEATVSSQSEPAIAEESTYRSNLGIAGMGAGEDQSHEPS